jgi:uncharacterized protein YbaP (TraB family)
VNFLLVLLFGVVLATSAESPEHFFWSVAKDKDTLWVLGSVHMARNDIYPLAPLIEDHFKNSQVLAVEADITEADVMATMLLIQKYGMVPKGESLQKKLKPAVYQKLDSVLTDWKVTIPMLQMRRPWLVALELTQKGLEREQMLAQNGIDLYFLNKAKGQKKIVALENPEDQFKIFGELNEVQDEALLSRSLEELSVARPYMDSLFGYWQRGDTQAMTDLVLADLQAMPEMKEFVYKMFDERNVKMAQKAEGLLKSGQKVFMVVGAAHLCGPQGIPTLMAQKGYRVKQW